MQETEFKNLQIKDKLTFNGGKDLETINKLKQEVEYWKNLYESLDEENRKQTKKSHWFN